MPPKRGKREASPKRRTAAKKPAAKKPAAKKPAKRVTKRPMTEQEEMAEWNTWQEDMKSQDAKLAWRREQGLGKPRR